ncbi:hypothetical protein WR25_09289 [Diploscapter pachys]|uniref:Regulatory protein zeste n=1 Tax=Diploscapter pachys TaxID=2018661 RepID=A0A2A2LE47_9BILA|nr:hypothetical protein WR25_09289 [Diploscapter pachys]
MGRGSHEFSPAEAAFIAQRYVESPLSDMNGASRKADANRARREIWAQIHIAFVVNFIRRGSKRRITVAQLQTKWKHLYGEARKKHSRMKRYRDATGAEADPDFEADIELTDADEIIIAAYRNTASFKGIQDGQECGFGAQTARELARKRIKMEAGTGMGKDFGQIVPQIPSSQRSSSTVVEMEIDEPPPAEHEPPPAEHESPPAEYEPPPAEYEPPPAEYEPPPAEHESPPAEYEPPPAEHERIKKLLHTTRNNRGRKWRMTSNEQNNDFESEDVHFERRREEQDALQLFKEISDNQKVIIENQHKSSEHQLQIIYLLQRIATTMETQAGAFSTPPPSRHPSAFSANFDSNLPGPSSRSADLYNFEAFETLSLEPNLHKSIYGDY